jgi:exosortase
MSDANTTRAARPDAWRDFSDCWRQLPNKGFFFALLAAWLALFQFLGNSTLGYFHTPSLFRYMWGAYSFADFSGDEAIGAAVPFLIAGLFWWKRRELLALPLKVWPPALLLVGLGLVLHIAGYLIEEPRVSIVAMFVGIYGLTGLAWGRAWLRHSFFPFALFIFCVPVSEIMQPVTLPLRVLVSALTEWTAHGIMGISVLRMGTELFDPRGTYQYDVVAACSGIRSFTAIFLLATVYGFITFRSPWKRLLLMALALPLAVLGNLVRMLCIIIAAEMGGQNAGNYVHEGGPLGIISLLPYIPAFVGLFLAGGWLEKKFGPDEKSQA